MGKGQHKCHWMLEQNTDGWSLARCKWCNRIEAFNNFPKYDGNGLPIVDEILPNQKKREFLRSQGVMISHKKWTEKEKFEVLKSVRKIGVTATAKKFKMAKQTVSFWFKGQTPLKKRSELYDPEFRKQVAEYAERTDNNYGTAKKFNVSRSSVQNWRNHYYGKRY